MKWLMTAAVAVALAASACGGDDNGALGQGDFDKAGRQLTTMIMLAKGGDIAGAERAFNETHSFSHILDAEMRGHDADALSTEITELLNAMHENLAGKRDAALFAEQGGRLRDVFGRGAAVLKLKPPA